MERSNQFLGTERINKLMRQYAVPCIISLLVAHFTISSIRSLLPMPITSALMAMRPTRSYFRLR